MYYETNNDLIVFKYSKSGNLMYKTAIESNFCRNLEDRLSGFHILGVPSLLGTRNFEVTVEYEYTKSYKEEHRKIDYDVYSIIIADKNASDDGDIGVTITCQTVDRGRDVSLIYDDIKSFEVTVYNKDTVISFPHYYDLEKSVKDKHFERICDTICKLIKTCIDNKNDIIKYYESYQIKYASAYDCSLPEFIIDNDDDEILVQLDPLNKEIRSKILNDELFK